jgi:3alpha(or 20beta)-hydroxysteroid dehydrogenase
MNTLNNKTALITGGAQGIGAATAKLFLEAGANVIITDNDEQLGAKIASELGDQCYFLPHDVSNEESWIAVVSQTMHIYNRIDILVNNAGVFRVNGILNTSLSDWHLLVAVNQTGTFLGIKSVVPVMKNQKNGSIINLSSIAGLSGNSRAPAYAATKWAVRGLTKSAALEFADFGIRVNSVHPGLIKTRMMDEINQSSEELDERVPLGRQGNPKEVSKMILFLASDDASHCSGHEFVVDGALKA